MGSIPLLKWTKRAFLLLTVATVAAGAAKGLPWLYLAAAFLLLCALSAHQATPHILNATQGLKKGRRTTTAVMVDDVYDSTDKKIETLDEDPFCWRFMSRPQGWAPKAGLCQAQLYWIDDVEWPVLVVLDRGLLYPYDTPQRVRD